MAQPKKYEEIYWNGRIEETIQWRENESNQYRNTIDIVMKKRNTIINEILRKVENES